MCLQSACIFKVENHKKIFEMLYYVISKKKKKEDRGEDRGGNDQCYNAA